MIEYCVELDWYGELCCHNVIAETHSKAKYQCYKEVGDCIDNFTEFLKLKCRVKKIRAMPVIDIESLGISSVLLDKMKHCIGLNYQPLKPYRNYYNTHKNSKDWNELVEKGFAEKGTKEDSNGNVYFWLTKTAVEMLHGKTISQKQYDDL